MVCRLNFFLGGPGQFLVIGWTDCLGSGCLCRLRRDRFCSVFEASLDLGCHALTRYFRRVPSTQNTAFDAVSASSWRRTLARTTVEVDCRRRHEGLGFQTQVFRMTTYRISCACTDFLLGKCLPPWGSKFCFAPPHRSLCKLRSSLKRRPCLVDGLSRLGLLMPPSP